MTSPAHSTKTTHTRAALVPRACRWFLKVLSLPREAALCRLRQGFLQGARTENESLRLHVLPASRRACREFGSDHEAEYGFLECCDALPAVQNARLRYCTLHDARSSACHVTPRARHGAGGTHVALPHMTLALLIGVPLAL